MKHHSEEKMDQNQNQKQLFFDYSDQMFVYCNEALDILEVNEVALDKFKVKREKIIGSNLVELAREQAQKNRIRKLKKVMETGMPLSLDINVSHPDYSQIYTRVKAVRLGNGLGLFMTDITELRLMRDEHKFLTNLAASEIKTPLTRLMYLTNEAMKSAAVNNESKNYFKEIHRELTVLDTTMHHVLDVTGSTLQGVVLQPVDIESVLENVLLMFSMNPMVEEIEFQKDIRIKSQFVSDVNSVFYILYEILENAIQFRKPVEFKPLVQIKFAEKDDSFVLTIADNGVGIAPSKLENLFVFQEDAESKPRGIGFGLFTAYKLVNKLHGSIKVKSKLRKGTNIEIYLPKHNGYED